MSSGARLPGVGALVTDLYELTMLQAYWREGMSGQAVFELFVRRLPPGRNFLVAAGLAQAVDYLETLRFSKEDLAWLASDDRFDRRFVESLARWRFEGDVDAMPEGTVCFADEPLLRVSAPMPQAQLAETRLLNIVSFQTSVASKAARCVLAAQGRSLVEFGLRRAHGGEAGLWAARAAYLAGFDATSAAQAAPLYGIPVSGTMAHSFIQAHGSERDAFERFARANPKAPMLLVDTYDADRGVDAAIATANRLAREGVRVRGIRLDSGDMAAQARRARGLLDAAGLGGVRIFASGNLDEREIARLLAAGAPIDGFGVGTRLSTSADSPYLDSVYKLEEYAGEPRRKRSAGKATWPGRKQVWRRVEAGRLAGDLVALEGEPADGAPLLEPVMRGGRRLRQPTLEQSRARARRQLGLLPAALRSLEPAPAYRVEISQTLRALAARLDAEQAAGARR